jgi:uncharacterized protein YbaR (Trm112 family)
MHQLEKILMCPYCKGHLDLDTLIGSYVICQGEKNMKTSAFVLEKSNSTQKIKYNMSRVKRGE